MKWLPPNKLIEKVFISWMNDADEYYVKLWVTTEELVDNSKLWTANCDLRAFASLAISDQTSNVENQLKSSSLQPAVSPSAQHVSSTWLWSTSSTPQPRRPGSNLPLSPLIWSCSNPPRLPPPLRYHDW